MDIWHCDAGGVYSGYEGNTQPGGGTPPTGPPPGSGDMHQEPVNDLTFLRGVQLADGHGAAEFATVCTST
ncbi:hypothetical protein [Actinomadura nitritigenes]|uniref:hypothetical protein n=1 Tax=Actinomadura nitritigenes TaxID=134602 RepID=UPI003D905257